MSGNGLNREGFLAARDTIAALKGTVECLQVNLSQERDANEGLNLTIESLRGENGSLQEKTFQLEAELDALKQEMKDEKNQKKQETAVPESEVRRELEKKLIFILIIKKNLLCYLINMRWRPGIWGRVSFVFHKNGFRI